MTLMVSPSHEVDVATGSMGASASETVAVRAYRTALAVGSGKPIFPMMTGSIGAIAPFGPLAGTGGSFVLTVATKLVTADGDFVDPCIASLAAFSGLCATLMRSIPVSATPIARQAPDRATAVREISRTAAGLDDTSQVSRRRS